MKPFKLLLLLLLSLFTGAAVRAQSDPTDPQIICEGEIKFYRVDKDENAGAGTTGSTYAWSITAGTFAGTLTPNQGPVVAWAPLGSSNRIQIDWGASLPGLYTLTVIETSADGCDGDPINLNIQITPLVTPTFNAIGPLCQNSTPPSLPATSTNSITGTWSPATINTTAPGNTTYTFTPDAGQCADVTTLTINVTNEITPTFAAIGPLCQGSTAPLLPGTSIEGVTGSWSPATINTASAGTVTHTFTPDAGQCSVPVTLDVTITAPITPSFNPVAAICSGDALTALPTTSTNAITGSWSPALNNTATTTYTFTPDAGQCATTTTLTITVNSPTTPTFAAVAAICSGDALTALPTTSTNAITGSWSPALNNTTTTTYTFTPDAGQCATTTTLTITVNSLTTPTFAAVAAICSGDALTALPTTSTNAITGSWSPALNNTATTTYTFTPDAGQCATTTTLTITVNSPTTPTFAAVAAICSGDALTALPTTSTNAITGSWSPALNNTATTTYTFTPDAGQCATTTTLTITVNSPTTPTFAAVAAICSGDALTALPTTSTNAITGSWSPALNNTATTTYTFTPDAGQCATTTTLTITVNALPTLTIAAGPTCSADLLTWSLDVTASGGTVSTTAGSIVNTSGNNWTVSGIPAGTNITLTVVDGCQNTLAVNAPNCNCPTVPAPAGTDAAYCAGTTPVPALVAAVQAGLIVNWYDAASGGTLVGTGSPFNPPAPGTYYAEAVDPVTNCVSATRTPVTLTENALPTVTASGGATLCEGESATLTANGASTYSWSPTSGLSPTTGTPVTATPGVGTTVYTVTGTDSNGCQNTATVTVIVNPRPVTSPIFHD
jgi:hypothetical protein